MVSPGETEAGTAGMQPCRGISRWAHRDDEWRREGSVLRRPTSIGSKDPHALKIPARRAEYSLTENVASPFHADGTFKLPIIVPVTMGQSPVWITTGDLRGIGRTDLVVAEADSNSVGVFLSNGDGTFVESVIALTNTATCLAVADFNNDGKLDIVVPFNDENSNVYIAMLPGNGKGAFGSAIKGRRRTVPWWPKNTASGVFWAGSTRSAGSRAGIPCRACDRLRQARVF